MLEDEPNDSVRAVVIAWVLIDQFSSYFYVQALKNSKFWNHTHNTTREVGPIPAIGLQWKIQKHLQCVQHGLMYWSLEGNFHWSYECYKNVFTKCPFKNK
jgi:hypothetical protein